MAPDSTEEPSANSTGSEPVDLTSSPYSLHRAVYARRAEYVRPHRFRIKIGTWNVGASPGTDKDLASWFVSGKGVDKRLATVDVSNNPAIEREDTLDSLGDADPNAVRLVGGDKVSLYVLGLQEVVDLNVASQYMSRVYADPGQNAMDRWKMALEAALPPGYELVSSEQMSGLLLLIYAAREVASTISNVSTSSIGTGLLGYMGNKGSVATRMVLGETTRMVFINCHLASGNDTSYVERRRWDVGQILNRTQFEPIIRAGVQEEQSDKIGDEDFTFWFGDLNFRLDDLPGDDIRHLLMLHTRGEYDVTRKEDGKALDGEDAIVLRNSGSSDEGSESESASYSTGPSSVSDEIPLPDPDDFLPDPSEDPASLQATLDSLLPHDQLRKAMKERKLFQDGWREGPITFLPTYKYDIGTIGLFDSSEKRRAPSWCDRILFRTRKDKEDYDRKIKEEEESKKRDEEMQARGIDHAGDEDEVLFDYDPENDGEQARRETPGTDYDEYDEAEDERTEDVASKGDSEDRAHLDIYTSHQRIQSSDHKPMTAVFTLDYDAVSPELKAKVHAEVARELDRAENEARPVITIVIDGHDVSGGSHEETKAPADGAVDFGDVAFLRRKTRSLTIANTGRVPAKFSFVDKPTTEETEGAISTQWLSTSFARPDPGSDEPGMTDAIGKDVTLEPGETVNSLLEIFVGDLAFARALNDGQHALEDVLVLRVSEGRDYFLPVRAIWLPTCIGRSVDELIRVPDGGIRKFIKSLPKGKRLGGSIPYEMDVRCAAPKELFKLTEAAESLTERVLADEQMLEESLFPKDKPGWPFEAHAKPPPDAQVAAVVAALDDDKHISDAFDAEMPSLARLEAVSRTLLLFLDGLTDGIVTVPAWTRIAQASLVSLAQPASSVKDSSQEDDKTTILDILSSTPNHNISFVFLTTTLAKVISELSPLSLADLDALKSTGRGIGSLGRRSLSFRKSGPTASSEALAALERRQAREKRYAEIFGPAVCRTPTPAKDKERKAIEDREKAIVELFLRRPREDTG